jgi:hypothetical protein
MSFILDALRKVDRERPAEGSNGTSFTGAPTSTQDPGRRRREVTVMTSIAVASAVLTAVAFMLVSRSSNEARNPSVDAAAPSDARLDTTPPAIELQPVRRELPPVPRRPLETALADAPAESEVVERREFVEAASDLASPEPPPSDEAPGPEDPGKDADPSPARPQLVLQGTSFINGIAVAVINDRRVFEGDTIEGAVVIRIDERSVELEFEGRRFTISL